ncbi:MAG: 6-carboxyhexanoate--CoA ligase [Nitrospirota bacterium]
MANKMLHNLWSVRMRASKNISGKGQGTRPIGSLSQRLIEGRGQEMHISGAEGIYGPSDIDKVIKSYYQRAVEHSRGLPDEIVITVERLKQRPDIVSVLPVSTIKSGSPSEAHKTINGLLSDAGLSKKAIENGLKVVCGKKAMRGASMIKAESGIRAEPDRKRGVRVSMLGMDKGSEKAISMKLTKARINTTTVKEALTLASKVASCGGVIAELCISDDPDYTTGYVTSKRFGYIRIPRIKQKGSLSGGRVFFIKERADVKKIIEYLEKRPVIAKGLPEVGGAVSLNEVLSCTNS